MAGPSLYQRTAEAVKAFRMVFGRGTGTGWTAGHWNLTDPWWERARQVAPQEYDFIRSAGNLGDNSAVAICLGVVTDNFTEPSLEVVERQADGTTKKVPEHPLVALIETPNAWDDLDTFWNGIVGSYLLDGNAYAAKVKDRGGAVRELHYLPHWQVRPESDDPYRAVTRYVFTVDGDERTLAPEEVIHFRSGRDPQNPRLGCSRLKKLIREVAADNEATTYTAAILQNMGVVGGMLTNEDDQVEVTKEKAELIKAHYRQQFTGAGRGGLMVPTFKAKYTELGRSPEQMALDKIRQVPEDRICAAMRVPAMVAGLTSGAAHKTYANYGEARKSFYEDGLMPLQWRLARALTRYLLAEMDPNPRRFCRWDYDHVRAVQPDLDKLSTRTVTEWQGDVLTLDEAREKINEKPVGGAEGKLFFTQWQAQNAPKPEPPPLPPPESSGDRAATQGANGQVNGNGRPFAPVKADDYNYGVSDPSLKFSASQPRDSHGRWSATGGGSAGFVESRQYGTISLRAGTEEDRKRFKIPPAYTNVRVADHVDEGSPLQWVAATPGGGAKYGYSAAHEGAASQAKFERVKLVAEKLPAMREVWGKEIADGGKNAHEALALRLVAQTGFRNGGETRETFGVSTLRSSHARVDGDKVHFDFEGKAGVRQRHSITDPVLARHVETRQAGGHERLFETNDTKTLSYLKKSSGEDFKVHDLRTHHATVTAAAVVERLNARGEAPKNAAEFKTQERRAVKIAARRLGDTEGVTRERYVDPHVFQGWRTGTE